MRKVFVDANMFMEIMFARSRMERVNELFHDASSELFMSTLTVHILYYFAELEGIDRDFVKRLVDLAHHLPMLEETVVLAQYRYNGKDFEDCLQAACAEQNDCIEILTLDKKFASASGTKLPVRLVR